MNLGGKERLRIQTGLPRGFFYSSFLAVEASLKPKLDIRMITILRITLDEK